MHLTYNLSRSLFCGLALATLLSCQSDKDKPQAQVISSDAAKEFSVYPMKTPNWFRNAILFHVDFVEGDLKSFAEVENRLPMLKEAGINTVVLSQVYACDEDGKIVDHTKVNPNLGTFEELKSLTEAIRSQRMQTILEWSMNQPSSEHVWHDTNPQWFSEAGDFDFDQTNLETTLIECMKFWLRASAIGGFLALDAIDTPDHFWKTCRPQLDDLKPVLMLTDEVAAVNHHLICFEVSAGQNMDELVEAGVKGNTQLIKIIEEHDEELAQYPATYNRYHRIAGDASTASGRLELGLKVLMDGIPMYTDLDQLTAGARYTRLLNLLKQHNKALWNVDYDSRMDLTAITNEVLLIKRTRDGQQVNVLANLSEGEASFTMPESLRVVSDLVSKTDKSFRAGEQYSLLPHQLVVLPNPSIEI